MTTTDRDRLAGIIAPALVSTNPSRVQEFDDLLKHAQRRWIARASEVADVLLAAGVTLPRRIETVEELDALPIGSVVGRNLDDPDSGDVYVKRSRLGDHRHLPTPLTVLWTPGGAQ